MKTSLERAPIFAMWSRSSKDVYEVLAVPIFVHVAIKKHCVPKRRFASDSVGDWARGVRLAEGKGEVAKRNAQALGLKSIVFVM